MIYEVIELKDRYGCVHGGTLKVLGLDCVWGDGHGWVRPMVIVVPGGAYFGVSNREAEPVAAEFLARGYQVAVLKYLCQQDGAYYPEQIFELACAVDHIKKNAAKYHVNPDEIFAVGFSAGGHLVADYSDECASIPARAKADLDVSVKAVGLSYPVIDDHDESFDNLLCGYTGEEKARLKESLKLPARVTKGTPPTFIWTTATDGLVPAANSLRYALALAEKDVPYELHVYPVGDHGKSCATVEVNDDEKEILPILAAWVDDMARFFRTYCEEAR